MKIGFVLDDSLDKSDGVQQYVLTVGRYMEAAGHEVHYLVANTRRKDIKNVHSLGRFLNVRYNHNNVRLVLPASRRQIRTLLREQQFDVLHVQLPYSPFLAKQVIRYAGPKTAIIGTFHILPASKLHGLSNYALKQLLGRSLKRFDEVVAVSEPALRFARKVYGLNTSVVPNAIDLSLFEKGIKREEFKGRKKNIVFLGRLIKRKGVLELIRAYNALPDELAKTTRLVICGKGPLRRQAQSLVAEGREVTFTGFVQESDKAGYLASADIAVFPSLGGESFGIVLIEAMAAGSGVVLGGNNPGYASVLAPQPYLLFDPRDTRAFSEHLALFITDTASKERYHVWQKEAVKQYGISVVGKRLEQIYREQLHARQEMR
jgi:phosphatidylinositol alpha-mannosyltransferase